MKKRRELKDFIMNLRGGLIPLHETTQILRSIDETIVQDIWTIYSSDCIKRGSLVMQRLGHSLNPTKLRLEETERKQMAGLLSQKEEETFERERFKVFTNDEFQDGPEIELGIEERWESQRFAWLVELYLEHGKDVPRLVCSEELTPPSEAAFEYMLPEQRPMLSPSKQEKEPFSVSPEDVAIFREHLIKPIYRGERTSFKEAFDKCCNVSLSRPINTGIVMELTEQDAERWAVLQKRHLNQSTQTEELAFYLLQWKKAAGLLTSDEKRFYNEELLLPVSLLGEVNISKEEQEAALKWMLMRYAWLLDMYLEHGHDMPRLVYEGKLIPPPEAAIDYKLPTPS